MVATKTEYDGEIEKREVKFYIPDDLKEEIFSLLEQLKTEESIYAFESIPEYFLVGIYFRINHDMVEFAGHYDDIMSRLFHNISLKYCII